VRAAKRAAWTAARDLYTAERLKVLDLVTKAMEKIKKKKQDEEAQDRPDPAEQAAEEDDDDDGGELVAVA
jgi:hypothetical protein